MLRGATFSVFTLTVTPPLIRAWTSGIAITRTTMPTMTMSLLFIGSPRRRE